MLRGPPHPLRASGQPSAPSPPPLPCKCEPARRGRPPLFRPDLCLAPTPAGVQGRPADAARGREGLKVRGPRGRFCRTLRRARPPAARPPLLRLSCFLSLSLKVPLPAKSALLQEGWGKGRGAQRGCRCLLSLCLPHPQVRTRRALRPPPPLHSRLAPGEGGWRCRGCSGCRRAARGAPHPRAATLRPQPPSPARLEGLRGESRSARPAAPANLPAPRWGVCPARWEPRCRPRGSGAGARSSLPAAASSAFAKLQSQQPAGPGGRVQLGCANFDTRASCEDAAAS